jgi:short-subunit dehydrogenase
MPGVPAGEIQAIRVGLVVVFVPKLEGSQMSDRALTAVVTGASGGIGEELARVLAAEGYALVLVARTTSKLNAIAEELTRRYGTACHVVAADLSDPGAPAMVESKLSELGLAVDVLVNNAGFATHGDFKDIELRRELGLIQVNIASLVELTRRLLPGMVRRGWGRILNLSSTAAYFSGPLMADYYASKAFVLSFSVALNEELRGTGVSVTALCPGPTASGFQARAAIEDTTLVRSARLMSAAAVAREGFQAMIRGRSTVIPGFLNRAQAFVARLMPRSFLARFVKRAHGK